MRNVYCAIKCDAVANKLTASPNIIGYRVAFSYATSISASSVQKPLEILNINLI